MKMSRYKFLMGIAVLFVLFLVPSLVGAISVNFNGNLRAKIADIGEWIPAYIKTLDALTQDCQEFSLFGFKAKLDQTLSATKSSVDFSVDAAATGSDARSVWMRLLNTNCSSAVASRFQKAVASLVLICVITAGVNWV